MQRIHVVSSNILAIGYDDSTEVLEVEFKDGSVYQYERVPADEHQRLMEAESHGKYLNARIKGRYNYRRL